MYGHHVQKIVSTAVAAEILGVSIPTICRLARAGELPALHKGRGRTGAWLFDGQVVQMLAIYSSPRALSGRRGRGTAGKEPHNVHDNAR